MTDSEVTIKVLNLGTIENTPMGKMIVRTLLSVAEMESLLGFQVKGFTIGAKINDTWNFSHKI